MTDLLKRGTTSARSARTSSSVATRQPSSARWLPAGIRLSPSLDAVLIGVLAFLLTAAFSWVPSLWYDEAATVVAATRSWPELWRMLDTVDVVHGAYYAAMHLWFTLVGYSPFTLRIPSAAVTGLAVGGLVVLGRILGGRRFGFIAGLAMCFFPRVTWMGAEGRSYALSTALAVALTLVFLGAYARAARSLRVRALWWGGYAVLAAASSVVFIFLAFLVAAHGVTAVWSYLVERMRQRPGSRGTTVRSLLGWSAAAACAGVACIPFALETMGQSGQIEWIDKIGTGTFHAVFVTQLFPKNYAFTTVAWTLVVLGVIVLVLAALGRWRRLRGASGSLPTLASVAVPFLVVPTVLIVVASVLADPLYSPRYLTFTAPGAALLVAVGIDAFGRTRWVALVLAALVAMAAPQYVAQRQPEVKQESSWEEVADLVATERAKEPPGTEEAVISGPVRRHATATTRVIMYSYPDAFEGLEDFALKTPAATSGQLWEKKYRVRDTLDRLDDDTDVVWLITSNKQDWRPGITARLAPLGFTLDEEWNPSNVNVLRYRR